MRTLSAYAITSFLTIQLTYHRMSDVTENSEISPLDRNRQHPEDSPIKPSKRVVVQTPPSPSPKKTAVKRRAADVEEEEDDRHIQ